MGYYSSVAIVVKKDDYSRFVHRDILKYSLDEQKNILYFVQKVGTVSKYRRENLIFIFWKDVKWYEGDTIINAITDNLLNDNKDDQYEFMRIGEDYDDFEHRVTFSDFYLDLRREIEPSFYAILEPYNNTTLSKEDIGRGIVRIMLAYKDMRTF